MAPTFLSTSVGTLSQSVFVVFGTILLFELEANGTISRISPVLASGNFSALGGILLSHQVLYMLIEYLGAAFVVSTILTILANGFVYSSEYLCYLRAIDDSRVGIATVMSFLKRKWKSMSWTLFLVDLLSYLPVGLLSLIGVWLVISSGIAPLSFVELEGLFLLGIFLTSLASFLLMYSLISVAVEDLSGVSALKRSCRLAASNFGISLTYALVRILSVGLITLVAGLATTVGVPLASLAAIAIALLLVPVLHLAKTQIYLQIRVPIAYQETEAVGIYGTTSATKDLFGGSFLRFGLTKLKQGIRELKTFILDIGNIPYHVASVLAFVVGIFVGTVIATHGLDQAILSLGYTPGQINPTILRNVPFTTGLDIFLHNWQVSLATALSGMWLVAPSLLTLAFNGMILGVVYYLTPNFTMFAAAIFPHGSIEIPSFVLAGSAGMRLGVAFIRSLGKGIDSPEQARFERVGRETIYIVVGLAVLFFIAGLIEGNITPIIMRMFGWK